MIIIMPDGTRLENQNPTINCTGYVASELQMQPGDFELMRHHALHAPQQFNAVMLQLEGRFVENRMAPKPSDQIGERPFDFSERCEPAKTPPTVEELQALLARGRPAPPTLRSALEALLNRYVSLVQSGDGGDWDAEIETEVINARAALTAPVTDYEQFIGRCVRSPVK
jgi:hypothetical protein